MCYFCCCSIVLEFGSTPSSDWTVTDIPPSEGREYGDHVGRNQAGENQRYFLGGATRALAPTNSVSIIIVVVVVVVVGVTIIIIMIMIIIIIMIICCRISGNKGSLSPNFCQHGRENDTGVHENNAPFRRSLPCSAAAEAALHPTDFTDTGMYALGNALK